MADRREFEAGIEEGRGGGAFVVVPFDVAEAFGSRRPRVRAWFEGYEYRGSIASMGGRPLLGVTRAIREALGKGIGDRVRVAVEADTEPREVTVPDDLGAALDADPRARAAFDALSYTHRKEHVRWIEEAKKEETRRRRVRQTVAKLGPDGGG